MSHPAGTFAPCRARRTREEAGIRTKPVRTPRACTVASFSSARALFWQAAAVLALFFSNLFSFDFEAIS
jgi:hypothetical protein